MVLGEIGEDLTISVVKIVTFVETIHYMSYIVFFIYFCKVQNDAIFCPNAFEVDAKMNDL